MKRWIGGFVYGLVLAATLAIAADVKWSAFPDYTPGAIVTGVGLQSGTNVKFPLSFLLGLNANPGEDIAITGGNAVSGDTQGGAINITAGNSIGDAFGSSVNIVGGISGPVDDGLRGGTVNIVGGAGHASGVGVEGGRINITGGAGGGVSGNGGNSSLGGGSAIAGNNGGGYAQVIGGQGFGSGEGGYAIINGGGAGATGIGGDVVISSGDGGSTSGNSGDITIDLGSVISGTKGEIKIGGSGAIIPVQLTFIAGQNPNNATIFTASRAMRVKDIIGSIEVASGAASTATVKKAPSGTNLAGGTALHTGSFNANGTAATNQTLTLSSTAADLEIAAGDRIGIVTTGTWTLSAGGITVWLTPQ